MWLLSSARPSERDQVVLLLLVSLGRKGWLPLVSRSVSDGRRWGYWWAGALPAVLRKS